MSTIYDVANVKGFIRMCNDGWLQGWHERNGGNLTYRMTEEDVAACRPFFDETPREWVNMGGRGIFHHHRFRQVLPQCGAGPYPQHRHC